MDKSIRKKVKAELFKRDPSLATNLELQETNDKLDSLGKLDNLNKLDKLDKLDQVINELQKDRKLSVEGFNIQAIKGDKGEQGIRGEKGDKGDSIKGDKGDKGDRGPKGDEGLKGEKGDNGLDGQDGEDGSPDTPLVIATKLNTLDEAVEAKVIKGIPTIKDFIKEFRGLPQDQRLELTDLRNWNQPAKGKLDMRWHGGGMTKVIHDASLTGDGTADHPLEVSTAPATAFIQLTDVPHSYSGQTGKAAVVNGTETGLTFATISGTDEKVKATASDTTAKYLTAALKAGTGISIATYNPGGNEQSQITNSAPDQTVAFTNGTGISVTGTYPNFTVTNSLPDQTVSLTGAGITAITGTYPNFTITSTEVDPLSLHLDQTVPQAFTSGTVTGTGFLTVTAGILGLDTNTYQTPLTFSDSLVNTAGTVTLVNDSATPGNTKYYGTDSGGTLGFYSIPSTYTPPVTTKGDLFTFSTVPDRLGVGTDAYVLTADHTTATGLKWAALPSGMVYPSGSGVAVVSGGTSWGTTVDPSTPLTNVYLKAAITTGALSFAQIAYADISGTPSLGTWAGVNYPTWSSGTPFVKMTAAGTFSLDSNTYLTSLSGALLLDQTTPQTFSAGTVAGTGLLKVTSGTLGLDTNTYLTTVTPHNILSTTHGDTLADTVVRGDILYGNATPKWARLAFPSTPTGKILQATATDVAWSSNPLTIGASASVSGSNTGDQTIQLTSDVTGSGTGSFATTIANNAVTYAKFQQVAASSLVGNATASPANATGITLLPTLVFSGSALGNTATANIKKACRLAQTSALTATYTHNGGGSDGIGDTLTNSGTQAALVVDSVSAAVGDRIAVTAQATAMNNGIYTVTNVGSGSTNWVLTRATDFDGSAIGLVTYGCMTMIVAGTANAGIVYVQNTAGTITVGTSNISFIANQASGVAGGYVSSVSNSDSTLTISPTTGNVTASLNLGHANTWTAAITLRAGTTAAGTAPLYYQSGPLLTAPVIGAQEFLTDKYYATITTGTARKEFALWDAAGTSGRIPFETTNGRLLDTANWTWDNTNNAMTIAAGTQQSTITHGLVVNLGATAGAADVFNVKSGGDNYLIISDVTNDRIGIGIAAPTKKLGVSGDISLETAGNRLYIKEGTNGMVGQTTLVAGTKAITISGVTTNSRAFVTLVTPNTTTLTTTYQAVCTTNTLTIQANIAAGTINVVDISTLNYLVIN